MDKLPLSDGPPIFIIGNIFDMRDMRVAFEDLQCIHSTVRDPHTVVSACHSKSIGVAAVVDHELVGDPIRVATATTYTIAMPYNQISSNNTIR
jgi:hypothetical protein